MAIYRIVCTQQEPVTLPNDRAHIVRVGTGANPGRYEYLWTVDQVLQAMANSDVFYTQGQVSGKIAYVEPYRCTRCSRWFIRSQADAVQDNNVDYLGGCLVA